MTRLVDNVVDTPAKAIVPLLADPAATAFGINDLVAGNVKTTFERATYPTSYASIDRLTVTAHGIVLFNDFPASFFGDYTPWQYGGYNVNVSKDEGALMINFCLYPGTYQPSGHINISRAREFYIKYNSSYIGAASHPSGDTLAKADELVLGIAINFLLISDGSAVLRYST